MKGRPGWEVSRGGVCWGERPGGVCSPWPLPDSVVGEMIGTLRARVLTARV